MLENAGEWLDKAQRIRRAGVKEDNQFIVTDAPGQGAPSMALDHVHDRAVKTLGLLESVTPVIIVGGARRVAGCKDERSHRGVPTSSARSKTIFSAACPSP